MLLAGDKLCNRLLDAGAGFKAIIIQQDYTAVNQPVIKKIKGKNCRFVNIHVEMHKVRGDILYLMGRILKSAFIDFDILELCQVFLHRFKTCIAEYAGGMRNFNGRVDILRGMAFERIEAMKADLQIKLFRERGDEKTRPALIHANFRQVNFPPCIFEGIQVNQNLVDGQEAVVIKRASSIMNDLTG